MGDNQKLGRLIKKIVDGTEYKGGWLKIKINNSGKVVDAKFEKDIPLMKTSDKQYCKIPNNII